MGDANQSASSHIKDHIERQTKVMEDQMAAGPRWHTMTSDPLTRYLVRWRLTEALRRAFKAEPRLSYQSRVLVLCAAEGNEGSMLMDMGFTDVTVSDLSAGILQAAHKRDARLKTLPLNAEETGLPDDAYDIAVIQDGLHHLPRPVLGYTEMLRIASHAIIFLEPHDSLIGRRIGTKWEQNGPAINYVFRWTRRLVEDVASSYLGRGSFRNLSFSFWHHNVVLAKIGSALGGGRFAIFCLRTGKTGMDRLLSRGGNQFCGLIIKNRNQPSA
jgi:SAM-dependent methyltransferase